MVHKDELKSISLLCNSYYKVTWNVQSHCILFTVRRICIYKLEILALLLKIINYFNSF